MGYWGLQDGCKTLCGSFICIPESVDISVGGCKLGVAEPLTNGFDIRTIGKKQGCRGMPESVELSVRDSVPLQELFKLLGGSHRIHLLAIPLGEKPVAALPSIAQPHLLLDLLFAVFLQESKHTFRDRNGSDTSFGFRCFVLRILSFGLVCALLDGKQAALEINAIPSESDQFPSPCAGSEGKLDNHLEEKRFFIQAGKHLDCFFSREYLHFGFFHFATMCSDKGKGR